MLQTLLGSAAGFVFASVIHLYCRNRLSPILLCAVILAAVVTGSFSVLLVFYANDVPEFSYWMALLLGSFFAAPILKALPVQTNKSVTQKSRAFGLFILWISMGIVGFGATYVMATVTDEDQSEGALSVGFLAALTFLILFSYAILVLVVTSQSDDTPEI
ncbi:MAG: hypothetical protein ABL888_16085 [Pirellulaceae bacterium]